MGSREIIIVKTAFNKVKEHFHVPVVLNFTTNYPGTSLIQISYNILEDGKVILDGSQAFASYGFNKEKGERVIGAYRKKNPYKYLNCGVEKLVSSKLNLDEDTMAVLRVAAKLFLEFRKEGLIR